MTNKALMDTQTKTYRQLIAERAELDRQIEQMRSVERNNAIAQIHELMAQFDIAADELETKKKRTGPRKPVEGKYRDPESGATWSGRGKPPRWIAGKDRTQFLISPAT